MPPIQMCKKNDISSIKWKLLDISFAKLNFDSVVSHPTSATIDFIIRDDIDNHILIGEKKSHSPSVQVTRREELSIASQRGIKKI